MGILKGFAVIAKVGEDQEGNIASTNSTLNLTANTTDVTTKDNVVDGILYPEEDMQNISGELTIEGYVREGEETLTVDIGDSAACSFQTGKRIYSFAGVVKTLNWTGDVNGNAGYSLTVQSKGKITKETVS